MSERKVSITGTIRGMEIGDQLEFPIEKRIYLQNIISYRLKALEAKKKWSSKSDNQKGTVTITRIV